MSGLTGDLELDWVRVTAIRYDFLYGCSDARIGCCAISYIFTMILRFMIAVEYSRSPDARAIARQHARAPYMPTCYRMADLPG